MTFDSGTWIASCTAMTRTRLLRAWVLVAGLLLAALPNACSTDDTAPSSSAAVATVPDSPGVLLEVKLPGESQVVSVYGSDDGAGTIVITALDSPTPDGPMHLDIDESASTLVLTLGAFRLDLVWNAAGDVTHYSVGFAGVTAYSGGPLSGANAPDLHTLALAPTTKTQSLATQVAACTERVRFHFFGPQRNASYQAAYACVEKDPAIAEQLVALCVLRDLILAFETAKCTQTTVYREACKQRLHATALALGRYGALAALALDDSIARVRAYYLDNLECPDVKVPDAGPDGSTTDGGDPDSSTDAATEGGSGSVAECNAIGDITMAGKLKSESPGSYCTGDLELTNTGARWVNVAYFVDETKVNPSQEKDAYWQTAVGPGATVKVVVPPFSWQSGGAASTVRDVAAVYGDADYTACNWILTDLTEDEINDCGIPTHDASGLNPCAGN